MSTKVEHTQDHRGMTSSTCPRCHTLFAYWDEEDLDENGDLLCYCDADEVRTVNIPGTFAAVIGHDGVAFTFTPHGSAAGYFGPDGIDADTGETVDAYSADGSVHPVWQAIQDCLASQTTIPVVWSE